MFTNSIRKWIVVVVGVLALALLTGAGTALARPAHHGPATSTTTSTQAVQVLSQTGHEQELVGVVQSVDQAKQTFTLLPTGQAKAVTIAYDAHTSIHNDHRALPLTTGMHVIVHVVTNSDGTLYASEIEPIAAHGSAIPAGAQQDSYPHGSCDGTGPHGPDDMHDRH